MPASDLRDGHAGLFDRAFFINSDGATVSAQLAAAKAAGVKRVLLHFSADGPTDGTSAGSLEGARSGLAYS